MCSAMLFSPPRTICATTEPGRIAEHQARAEQKNVMIGTVEVVEFN